MLKTIRKFDSTITVFSTEDLKGDIQLRLGSSGSIKNMNTLVYDDIDKNEFEEVCRINMSIYSTEGAGYRANGWEISDMYKQTTNFDGWYEVIQYKHGGFQVGDIDGATVNRNDIQWAYSADAVVINNGEDVCQCPAHRQKYFVQKHPRTFWGITADGHYILCTAAGRLTNEAGLTGDEVRHVLKELGCVWGFMSDGGKSSQMLIDGKLVNKTVTGSHYPVRNALFVYKRKNVVEPETGTDEGDLKARVEELETENERLKKVISQIREVIA